MKKTFRRVFTKEYIFLLFWPFLLWFGAAWVSMDENIDLLHHPIEYIILFFILNLFGCALYKDITEPRSEEKIEAEEKIIYDYSCVLEISSTSTCIADTFLPYHMNEIKNAIKFALLFEKDTKQIEVLKWGYICLAKFLPLEEALIVFRVEKLLLEEAEKKVLPYKVKNHKDKMLMKKYDEIQGKVAKKMEELLHEVS